MSGRQRNRSLVKCTTLSLRCLDALPTSFPDTLPPRKVVRVEIGDGDQEAVHAHLSEEHKGEKMRHGKAECD